jgi:hypothetical protein
MKSCSFCRIFPTLFYLAADAFLWSTNALSTRTNLGLSILLAAYGFAYYAKTQGEQEETDLTIKFVRELTFALGCLTSVRVMILISTLTNIS